MPRKKYAATKKRHRVKAIKHTEELAASNKRISIQGANTTENTGRGFGLNKEAQARVEADLSRILKSASSSSKVNQRKLVATTSNDHDIYTELIIDHSPTPDETTFIDKHKSKLSKEKSSKGEQPDESRDDDAKSESSKSKNSDTSKRKEKIDSLQVTQERLGYAAIKGITKKIECFATSTNTLNSTLKRLKKFVDDSERNGACGVTRKLYKLKQLSLSRDGEAKQDKVSKTDLSQVGNILKTPLSSEYYEDTTKTTSSDLHELTVVNTPNINVNVDSNRDTHFESRIQPLAGDVCCPGTTIISPRSLLVRYEEKQGKNPNKSNLVNNVCNKKCKDLPFNGVFESKKRVDNEIEIERSLKSLKRTNNRNETVVKSCVLKCPKTVLVNPLDYLERYEKQTDNNRVSVDVNLSNNFCQTNAEVVKNTVHDNDYQYNSTRAPYVTNSVENVPANINNTTFNGNRIYSKRNAESETDHQNISGWQYRPELLESISNEERKMLPAEMIAPSSFNHHQGSYHTNRNVQCERNFVDKENHPHSANPRMFRETDTLEEELTKDYVFPKYVQLNPDPLRGSQNVESSRHMGYQNTISNELDIHSHSAHSSSYSTTSASTSMSSSQDLMGWLPGFHHREQYSKDYGGTEDGRYRSHQVEFGQPLQKVQAMDSPTSQDNQYRFYRRKLY